MLLHLEGQFLLREIGVVEAGIVWPPDHRRTVFQAVDEAVGDVADVDVIPLEILLEDHDVAVGDRRVDEVVDEEIEPHPRRQAEHGGQPQRDRVRAREHLVLGVDLRAAVERDRLEGRFLGAVLGPRLRAVAAVGRRIDDQLMRAPHPVDLADRLEIDRRGSMGIAIAQRRADERGQRNDHVLIRDHLPHQGGVTGVTADDLEGRVGAEMEEGRLAEHEAVDHGHPMAGCQEPFAEDRTEVTGSAGDENLVTHLEDTPGVGKNMMGGCFGGGVSRSCRRGARSAWSRSR